MVFNFTIFIFNLFLFLFIVLSRSAFQWDTQPELIANREEMFPFPPPNPSSRASTPKNIRGSTPRASSSPRRPAFADPPPSHSHHYPLQSSIRSPSPPRPPSTSSPSSSHPHDHLIVTPLRGSRNT